MGAQEEEIEFGEEGVVGAPVHLLSPGLPHQSLCQGLALCPLWENACCTHAGVCQVLRGSPGATIAWVGAGANFASPTSNGWTERDGEVILVMLLPQGCTVP